MAAVAVGAATALYFPIAAGLVRQWYEDPGTAYGPLVLLAACVAIRQRWPRLRSLPPYGSVAGAAALVGAIAVYVIGTLAADVFLLRLSMVAFLGAVVWFVLGAAHARVLLPPLALCLVAIPLPAALVTELTLPLQLAASRGAELLLTAGGVAVERDGNVLALGYITLEVAEACSGMRSLVTLLALIAVYWSTAGPSLPRVLLLAAAAVPVAIVGNSLRVVATALLAARMGDQAAAGRVHDATGFAAFLVMCTALAAILTLVSRSARIVVRQA